MIDEKLIKVVLNHAKHKEAPACSETLLSDDLGIDSKAIVQIIMDLEEEFDIEIDMAQIKRDSFKTIETLKKMIETLSAA